MMRRMSRMFSLSRDEVAELLAEHKDVLELSDAQVQQIAERIAASQEQMSAEAMKGMMGRMQSGEMRCSCARANPDR